MICETCEHYEDDYIDAWYMDRMMTIKVNGVIKLEKQ